MHENAFSASKKSNKRERERVKIFSMHRQKLFLWVTCFEIKVHLTAGGGGGG